MFNKYLNGNYEISIKNIKGMMFGSIKGINEHIPFGVLTPDEKRKFIEQAGYTRVKL